MSGQWWENDLIVGPFTDLPAANAWAAANPSSLFNGLLATAGGVQYRWGGTGVGWESVIRASNLRPSNVYGNALISGNLFDGSLSVVGSYLRNDGVAISAGPEWGISNPIAVSPGDVLIVSCGLLGVDQIGGFYTGSTWVSSIQSVKDSGSIVVPASVTHIKITTNSSTGDLQYVYKIDPSKLGIGNFKIVSTMGDSIAYGLRSHKNYSKIIADEFSAELDNNGILSSTVGASANNPMYMRMNEINPAADLVLFEGGVNDWSISGLPIGAITDTSGNTFYGALNICASYLSRKMPFAKICWITVPKWFNYSNAPAGADMTAYMDAFKAVARKYCFALADCYTLINFDSPTDNVIASSDGAHPNDIGHQRMADIILESLRA